MADASSPAPAPRALFLSYAREDASVAKRLCDALRGFGMEVWFDQNELRGGDMWDQKIRQQIRTCALFVPIISATTQARGEGYFRREWKTAVERMADMAHGIAFLLPIVIDGTEESEALVPDEFRRVHWTFLRDGMPTPEFVAQVKQLVDNPRVKRAAAFAPATHTPAPPGPKRGFWPWVVAGAAVCAAAAAFLLKSPAKPAGLPVAPPAAPAPTPAAEAVPTAPAAHPAINEKSLAILPFTNMSEEKDTSYFADGVHEDLLTNLAMVKDLRVVSRTSVLRYKETTKSIPEIAAELGVAYILEGSVQRSGNRVRVTGQLIKAASDEHVWAKSYDRDLTDTFAIQADLATEIAGALAAQISPQEQALLSARPTDNPTAYDLYLKARQIANDYGPGTESIAKEVAYYRSAVALDPKFAAAWGELADALGLRLFNNLGAAAAGDADEADAAMTKALELAPASPDVIGSYGTYLYYTKRDYDGAIAQYLKLRAIRPHSADICNSLEYITRRQGHWKEACEWARQSIDLDPKVQNSYAQASQTYLGCKRFDEAMDVTRRSASLADPEFALLLQGYVVSDLYTKTHDRSVSDRFIESLTPELRESRAGRYMRMSADFATGDFQEGIRLYQLQPTYVPLGDMTWDAQLTAAQAASLVLGDRALAASLIGDGPQTLRRAISSQPKANRLYAYLGAFETVLGEKEQARADLDKSLEMVPLSRDALQAPVHLCFRVYWEVQYGDKEKAIDQVRKLLRIGNGFCLVDLYHNPGLYPLHGMPRFEAMKQEPELDAPIDGPGTF